MSWSPKTNKCQDLESENPSYDVLVVLDLFYSFTALQFCTSLFDVGIRDAINVMEEEVRVLRRRQLELMLVMV